MAAPISVSDAKEFVDRCDGPFMLREKPESHLANNEAFVLTPGTLVSAGTWLHERGARALYTCNTHQARGVLVWFPANEEQGIEEQVSWLEVADVIISYGDGVFDTYSLDYLFRHYDLVTDESAT